MTESELVWWQFWGLAVFFGLGLPLGVWVARAIWWQMRRFKRGVRGSDG